MGGNRPAISAPYADQQQELIGYHRTSMIGLGGIALDPENAAAIYIRYGYEGVAASAA